MEKQGKKLSTFENFLRSIKLKGPGVLYSLNHIVLVEGIITAKTHKRICNVLKKNEYDPNWKNFHNQKFRNPLKINMCKYLATLVISLYVEFLYNSITMTHKPLDDKKISQLKCILSYYTINNWSFDEESSATTMKFKEEQLLLLFFAKEFKGNFYVQAQKTKQKKQKGTINDVYILLSSMSYWDDKQYYNDKRELKTQVIFEIMSMAIHHIKLRQNKKFDYYSRKNEKNMKIFTHDKALNVLELMEHTTEKFISLQTRFENRSKQINASNNSNKKNIMNVDDSDDSDDSNESKDITFDDMETPKTEPICGHKQQAIQCLNIIRKQNEKIITDTNSVTIRTKEVQQYMKDTQNLNDKVDTLKQYLNKLQNDISKQKEDFLAISQEYAKSVEKNKTLKLEIGKLCKLKDESVMIENDTSCSMH